MSDTAPLHLSSGTSHGTVEAFCVGFDAFTLCSTPARNASTRNFFVSVQWRAGALWSSKFSLSELLFDKMEFVSQTTLEWFEQVLCFHRGQCGLDGQALVQTVNASMWTCHCCAIALCECAIG